MKIFLMAASLRQDSTNKKLIRQTAELVKNLGHSVDLAEFNEFDMPLYHGELEAKIGLPEGTLKFIRHLQNTDAFILSSPEYNFSTPGTLKNLIDWVSRGKPVPWVNQHVLLLSASPALVGGNRGLWQTRIPLECCSAFVYPDMFSLASAYEAFDGEGSLLDKTLQNRLLDLLKNFLKTVQLCKNPQNP